MKTPVRKSLKPVSDKRALLKAAADLSAMPAIVRLEGVVHVLAARVVELEHDFAEMAVLSAEQLGEPFRTRAKNIVEKRQTGVKYG